MLLVTGASGFLGSAIVRAARAQGLAVHAMVQESSPTALLDSTGIAEGDIVRADMTDPTSLRRATEGVDAVVHCAATTSEAAPDLDLSRRVNVEGTQSLLDACQAAGVRRFIQISSQSAHPANPSVYGCTKMEADERVQAAANIDWTILKPSIIYGPQARGVFAKMVRYCDRLPVVPVLGSGREEMRPIHADDVAAAVLACLAEPVTIGRTYDLGGADVLAFTTFIDEILRALGKRKMRAHLPLALAMLMARAMSLFLRNPPITPDNVRGIETVRHVDISAAQRDFGFSPRAFGDGLEAIVAAIAKR